MSADGAPAAAMAGSHPPSPAPRGGLRLVLRTALVSLLALLGLALAGFGALLVAGWILARSATGPATPAVDDPQALQAEKRRLEKKIEMARPKGLFLVVDTGSNRLTVRDGERVVREVVVSCGSGGVLEDPKGGGTWVFDTPPGERVVKPKGRNPSWIEPDWPFIESPENAAVFSAIESNLATARKTMVH